MNKTEKILKERGNKYGEFKDFAEISQKLKDTIFLSLNLNTKPEFEEVNNVILEGLEMICHKLARIANGDPYYLDSWRDLSAYAKLVCDELEKTDGVTDVKTKQVVKKDGRWVQEVDLKPIFDKVNKIIGSKKIDTWAEKCLNCKYCNHFTEPRLNIDMYVCEHPKNLIDTGVEMMGKEIKSYQECKNIWKDCKYQEEILK